MRQIAIVSGKGGTGKTVIAASFATLAKRAIVADCDVDAADLHLLLKPRVRESHEFKAGQVAVIDESVCKRCGECIKVCRFDAIDPDFVIDPISCEGCGFCAHICPSGAIKVIEKTSGEWFVSDTRLGTLVHARLGIGEGNSGKLVALIRRRARELAQDGNFDWIIIDGPPGIGCPVIASLAGVDCAVVVTEPTLSGIHDAMRVVDLAYHFGITPKLLINKFDLNHEVSDEIEGVAKQRGVPVIGKIGFDRRVVEALVDGKTIIECGESHIKTEIIAIWNELVRELAA